MSRCHLFAFRGRAALALLLSVVLLASVFECAASASANTCDSEVVWIEVGPYFVDGQAELSDVTTDTAGLSLNLTLLVLDGRNTTTDQCTPLSGVKIDTWECDYGRTDTHNASVQKRSLPVC